MEESSFSQVLKNRYFLLLWCGQVFSQLADKMFFLFMVVLVTRDQFSNSAISGLTLVFTVPAVIFGSVAGVFVDRWNKKYIMVFSNIFRAAFVLMLLLPFSEKLMYLYLITFLVSTLTQFFAPAETSMIPEIVEKKDLLPANSLFMGTMLGSVVLGFALGAPLISRFDNRVTDIAIAGMYGFSALLLFFIGAGKAHSKTSETKKDFFREFKEGLVYAVKSRIILFSLIRLIIIFSAFAALSVLAIGFVNDVLYLEPVFFGYLLALTGLGMALGAGFAGKYGNRLGKENLVFSGFILTGFFLVILAFTSQVAGYLGQEKTAQQRQLYLSLQTLADQGKNQQVITELQTFLAPDKSFKPGINSGTPLGSLDESQLKSLARLIGLEDRLLLLLRSESNTSKIPVGQFLEKLSSGETTFKLNNGRTINISENSASDKTAEFSLALAFFLKQVNFTVYKDIFSSAQVQDKVLNSILVLSADDLENTSKLIKLVKLDARGFPTLDLKTKIEKLAPENLELLASVLALEPEDLSDNALQNLSIKEYLELTSGQVVAETTRERALALKTFLTFAKTPLIKTLLKKESSLFELLFAFTLVTLTGFSAALCIIPLQTILQETVSENMRGKVFGVQNMAVNTAMTVPMAVAGIAADYLDGRFFALKGVSLVMLITGLLILGSGILEKALNPSEKSKAS